MRKFVIILGIVLLYFTGFSQNETNIWYFGQNAGLDFNSGTPVPLLDGALDTTEGCATISNSSGNLLFYTDGTTVYNRNHAVMLNGTGLHGDISSTSSAIIVPKPNNADIYYIFTVDNNAGADGLQYSEVDMTLDGGLGGITVNKNILLFTPTTEKLTAIKGSITNEYWVVSHKWNSNEFIAYKVTDMGVNTTPITSAVGSIVSGNFTKSFIGQIKISPDGSKLAVARSKGSSEVQLFDFNATTGLVSNPLTVLDLPNTEEVYGVEFSPNSKVLYASVLGNGVYQYNLQTGSPTNIITSQLVLTTLPRPYGAMQLASDGKIYIAKAGKFYIDFITNPNILGTGCSYQYEGLYLGGRRSRLGLPPFIQSYLEIEDITFTDTCFGDATAFTLTNTVDSVTWDFGDPSTGVNNTSNVLTPTHIFSAVGTYTVTVNVVIGTQTATATTTVAIYEQPTATQPQNIQICDTDNDGFYNFDLTTQTAQILNGLLPTDFEVSYYATVSDYTNDLPIANLTTYTNTTAYSLQTITASVKNRSNLACESTTIFTIQVFETPMPSSLNLDLSYCDNTSVGTDSDGIITFDLTQNEISILNGQSATDFTINYYTNAGLSNQIVTPTNYQNINTTETIYVQMYNNNNVNCTASLSFTIEVFALPTIAAIVELKQCDDDVDGFSTFNLTEVNGEITTNAINETITYFETQQEAINNTNLISNPLTYTNQIVSTDTIWARIQHTNGCYRVAQINLIVSTTQIPSTYTRDFYACDDAIDGDTTNGISVFDFSSVHADVLAMFPVGQNLIITYYRNLTDALAENNPITNITNYRNVGYLHNQDIYIRVDSTADNDCLGLGHISLHVETVPVANPVTIPTQCDADGDGMYAFDTTTINSAIIGIQTDVNVRYFDANNVALSSPLPNPLLTASQTITARIENTLSQNTTGRCFDETTIVFTVEAAVVANNVSDLIICDDDTDGFYSFDTSTIENEVLNGQTGLSITYTDQNGVILPSPLPNPYMSDNKTITIRVENSINPICYDETTFQIIVRERPQFELLETDVICMNENPSLQIAPFNTQGTYTYNWTGPNNFTSSTEIIDVIEGGIYTVIATSTFGCESFPKQIIITEVEIPTLTIDDIHIIDDRANNSIRIVTDYFIEGEYEFSLDNIFNYQDAPYFEDVQAGIHTLYMRDKNHCGLSQIEISIIGYPSFFTPNGDGINDFWMIKGIESDFYEPSVIHIYNRYGKILAKVATNSIGWNGLYNNKPLQETDYWFSVKLVSKHNKLRFRKGHFTLKKL